MRFNPFNYTRPVAGGDFCGRPEETLRGTLVNIPKILGTSAGIAATCDAL